MVEHLYSVSCLKRFVKLLLLLQFVNRFLSKREMQSLDRLVIMLVASFFLCFTPLEIYHLLNIFNMGIRSGKLTILIFIKRFFIFRNYLWKYRKYSQHLALVQSSDESNFIFILWKEIPLSDQIISSTNFTPKKVIYWYCFVINHVF